MNYLLWRLIEFLLILRIIEKIFIQPGGKEAKRKLQPVFIIIAITFPQ